MLLCFNQAFFLHVPAGYKGYGLAFMVEIFCGILSGSTYAHHVRKWKDTHKEADLVGKLSTYILLVHL